MSIFNIEKNIIGYKIDTINFFEFHDYWQYSRYIENIRYQTLVTQRSRSTHRSEVTDYGEAEFSRWLSIFCRLATSHYLYS